MLRNGLHKKLDSGKEIRWIQLFSAEDLKEFNKEGLYLLEQNPENESVYGKCARNGHEIFWLVKGVPLQGLVKLTGRIFINGKVYDSSEGFDMATELQDIIFVTN